MIKVRVKKRKPQKPKPFTPEEKATIFAFYCAMAFLFFYSGAVLFRTKTPPMGGSQSEKDSRTSIPLSSIVNVCPPQFDHCNFKHEKE